MPEQGAGSISPTMLKALSKLPIDQREALLLVSAEGLSYEDAARICGTNIGTHQEPESTAPVIVWQR
jgi:RNA polymerase sigma-70 factor (ECF subfamily)